MWAAEQANRQPIEKMDEGRGHVVGLRNKGGTIGGRFLLSAGGPQGYCGGVKRGLVILAAWLSMGLHASEQTNLLSLSDLKRALHEHVSQGRFDSAMWGVKVVSLATGATLYETNSSKLLKPASNAKLYTGALALDRFGPEFRIRTSLFSNGEVEADGTLRGDLVVYGRGDFSMAARFNGGNYSNLLGHVVEAVKRAGIKRVEGNLIGDETYFRGPRLGSSWSWDDLNYYYGAEVSALTIQDNVIDLYVRPGGAAGERCSIQLKPETGFVRFVNRTTTEETNSRARINVHRPIGENVVYLTGQLPVGGSVMEEAATVSNPALWFVTLLEEALRKSGVEVAGSIESRSWPENEPTDVSQLKEIAWVESRPFGEMIEKMMKPSQNLYAQMLLLQVGAHSASSEMLAEDAGVREMRRFLERAGIAPGDALLDEGSGLSRSCLVTPRATVRLLEYMHTHAHAEVYKASLPEAGVDGTLRRRLKELKGNLRAKTGTLRYVNSLSGYMSSGVGEPLAFCVMLNAYNNSGMN